MAPAWEIKSWFRLVGKKEEGSGWLGRLSLLLRLRLPLSVSLARRQQP